MPPPTLTPKEKALKSRLRFIEAQFNKARASFSFKKINNLRELLIDLGHSAGEIDYAYNGSGNNSIDRNFIDKLEQTYKQRTIQEDNNNEEYKSEVEQHEYEGYTYPPNTSNNIFGIQDKLPMSEGVNNSTNTNTKEIYESLGQVPTDPEINWDTFFTSPLQKASLRGAHQRSTSKSLYQGFVRDNKRAMLLEGGAGNGKTYVAAAVVRKLIDHPSFFNGCRSPWPVLWITRASIVEQTSRVCRDDFGLCEHTECIVINVEQLRARFGGYMVESKTIVKGGEEHIIWTWKPRFHPLLFIVDECQLAKNEDSTQAKIISAIADIDAKEKTHILFMSATPFTRVSEAKYFAVNTHMEITGI